MRAGPFLLAAVLLAGVSRTDAADLSKIDRTISREPAYQSRSPRYCLLVFGPEAKTRVWLVQDGEALYVDRNDNGDLTEVGERVAAKKIGQTQQFEVGDIREGPSTHTGLVVMQPSPSSGMVVTVKVEPRPKPGAKPLGADRIMYIAGADADHQLRFAERSQDAPILHFNGPWTMAIQRKPVLTAGHTTELLTGVGTPGLGPGTFAAIAYEGVIPEGIHPVVELTFPTTAAGREPLRTKTVLTHRC
jgi:hypothetical protein